jgi:hypothetical protein
MRLLLSSIDAFVEAIIVFPIHEATEPVCYVSEGRARTHFSAKVGESFLEFLPVPLPHEPDAGPGLNRPTRMEALPRSLGNPSGEPRRGADRDIKRVVSL